MIQRKRAALRTQLIVGYTDILKQARKSITGLKTFHLFSIMLVGDNGGGVRLSEAALASGYSQQCIYNRFVRVIKAGFIQKVNKKYYLTSSGQSVYTTICREFDSTMKEIIGELVREAARRAG